MVEATEKTDTQSVFEGAFWRKLQPYAVNAYAPLLLVIAPIALPLLLLGTEKSNGNRFALGWHELAGMAGLVLAYVGYYFSFGESLRFLANLPYSLLAGAIAGIVLAAFQRRLVWLALGISGFLYTTVALFFLRILEW